MTADPAPSDDYVTVATFFDPTEARVLCGALRAVALDAVVGDGQTVQTDALLAIAVQVRVRVPGSQVAAARRAMEDIREGRLALEGDDAVDPLPAPEVQPAALFSPDAAALWSLVLTPVFGTALLAIDAWRDPRAVDRAVAGGWLVLALVATAVAGVDVARSGLEDAWFTGWLQLAAVTLAWYFACAMPLSAAMIRRYGVGYRRLPVAHWGLALLVLAALWCAAVAD